MARLPLVSPLDRILFLKTQPYLLGQSPDVLTVLASYTEERFCSRGASLRSGATRVDEVLFLVEGSVEIDEVSNPSEPSREVAAPGVIGLPHHFAGIERPPDVRALEDTLCLALDVGDLDQILEDHFSLLLSFAYRSGAESLRVLQQLGPNRPNEPGFRDEQRRETPARLDLVQRLARARRAPLFERTNLTVLSELVRWEGLERLEPGEILWRKGDPIDRMMLVLDGSLRLAEGSGTATAPSGAVVGAWEILSDARRTETWEAVSSCRLIPIRRDLFIDLLEDHFDFAVDYLRSCCERTILGWRALAAQQASHGASQQAAPAAAGAADRIGPS